MLHFVIEYEHFASGIFIIMYIQTNKFPIKSFDSKINDNIGVHVVCPSYVKGQIQRQYIFISWVK